MVCQALKFFGIDNKYQEFRVEKKATRAKLGKSVLRIRKEYCTDGLQDHLQA